METRTGMEREFGTVATDGGKERATSAFKTVEVDKNASRPLEVGVKLGSTGTEKKVTHKSETETNYGQNPNLEGPLPRLYNENWKDQAGPCTKREQWQTVTDATTLEERSGVNLETIQRRRGLLPDLQNGEPPYRVDEYIRSHNEVGLLDLKRFVAMSMGEGDTKVVRVRSGSRRFATSTGGWRVRWKYWLNIRKVTSSMLESTYFGHVSREVTRT